MAPEDERERSAPVGVNPSRQFISVVTPCFNEEENLPELFSRVRNTMKNVDANYEHIVIDNASTDGSRSLISGECETDPRVKAIFNLRSFGHIRSPFHALLQANGDCVISLAADLQEPPELIPDLLERWEKGSKVVLLQRKSAEERGIKQLARQTYYWLLGLMSSHSVVKGATGSGAYARSVIEFLKGLEDPYPYLRGLVIEAGFPVETVSFHQPLRVAGRSSNRFFALYDMAMLGFTTSGRTPLRAVSFIGYAVGLCSLLTAIYFLARKLVSWDSFQLGLAPLAIGLFFLAAVQLISLGIIGEYVGNIFVRQRNIPLVIEESRLNFDVGSKVGHSKRIEGVDGLES